MAITGSQQISRLHDVVDLLIKPLVAKATGNKSFFINEIPGHLRLGGSSPIIISMLEGLFSLVVSYSKDSCIRLSARMHSDIILVHVKNAGSFNDGTIASQLQTLQLLANKGRGYVAYSCYRENITSITLGFSNS